MEDDIRAVAKSIIQGNEKRKKRLNTSYASGFDVMAAAVVEDALSDSCRNISCDLPRKQMQDMIYKSIVYKIPYEYMSDVICGRRQFYDYRKEFITFVARGMGMISANTRG